VAKLAAAGFEAISIEPTRTYDVEDVRVFLKDQGSDVDAIAPQVEGKFKSGFIRAVKPAGPAKWEVRIGFMGATMDADSSDRNLGTNIFITIRGLSWWAL